MEDVQVFVFFNDTATTEIYTLSLHDALPIFKRRRRRYPSELRHHVHAGAIGLGLDVRRGPVVRPAYPGNAGDRKSTRLNSSHANISYAVFCLKKKTKYITSSHLCITNSTTI